MNNETSEEELVKNFILEEIVKVISQNTGEERDTVKTNERVSNIANGYQKYKYHVLTIMAEATKKGAFETYAKRLEAGLESSGDILVHQKLRKFASNNHLIDISSFRTMFKELGINGKNRNQQTYEGLPRDD